MSFVLYFKSTSCSGLIADQAQLLSGRDCSVCRENFYVVNVIANMNAANLSDRDIRNDQVVFVDVVGFADFSKTKVPSTIRVYPGKKLQGYQGERLSYSTCGWRFGVGTRGGHEGLTECLPSFIGRECYSRRIASLGVHKSGHDVIESRTEAVDAIADCERNERGYWLDAEAERLFSSLRITVVDDLIKVAVEVFSEVSFDLFTVAIGPVDF